jgi:excisionase family DNA binding protein
MAQNELLTPAEVAVMFRVNPKTVTRWARAGKISAVRTLGGHRRFHADEIRRFLAEVHDLPV